MWKRIPKENSTQPVKGKYSDWKELLAEEGFFQCVYCAIRDKDFGGVRNFHVEHYKPKSLYEALTDIFSNLFFACPVCNVFKGDKFPNVPDEINEELKYFPDPSQFNYSDFFTVEKDSGKIEGKSKLAKYLIATFHLNRPHLVLQRRLYHSFHLIEETEGECRKYLDKLSKIDKSKLKTDEGVSFYQKISMFLLEMNELKTELEKLRLYETKEDLR